MIILENKQLKIIIIVFLFLVMIVGFVLEFFLNIDSYYSSRDYLEIRDMMQISGSIYAVLCGILIALLVIIRSSKNNKFFWFLLNVLIYTIITYSYFVDLSTDVYGYINMQSTDHYVIINTSDIYAISEEDELGHLQYYIRGVGVNEEIMINYFSFNYKISKEYYLKIKREEYTVDVKMYKGKYGYYHSPEILD